MKFYSYYLYDKNKKINSLYIEKFDRKRILDIIKKNREITIITFDYKILLKIRSIDNNIRLGWLLFDYNELIKKKAKDISINELLFPSVILTSDKVNNIKKSGFKVSAWSIYDIDELKRLDKLGVKNIIYKRRIINDYIY